MMKADLDFADDNCLIDDNGDDIWKLLDNVTNNAPRVGIQLNVGKTLENSAPKILHQKTLENSAPMENTKNSMYTRACWEFTYLGCKIQLDDNVTPEVKARIEKDTGSFNNQRKRWK